MKTGKHVPMRACPFIDKASNESSIPLHPFQKNETPLYLGRKGTVLNTVPSCWVESSRGSAAASHKWVHSWTCKNSSTQTHVWPSGWFPKRWVISGESEGMKFPSESLHLSVTLILQSPKAGVSLAPYLGNQEFSLIPTCQEELNLRVLGEGQSLQIQDYSTAGPTIRRSPSWSSNEIDDSCRDNKGLKCYLLNLISSKLDSHLVPKQTPPSPNTHTVCWLPVEQMTKVIWHWLDLLI